VEKDEFSLFGGAINMYRFNFNDDSEEDEDEMDEEDVSEMIAEDYLHQAMIAEKQLEQDLLFKAVDMAQRDWFWSFRSSISQLERIEEIYLSLRSIIEE